MTHFAVPADTDPRTDAVLVERWRSMEIAERAALVERLCLDVEQVARAGIAARHPHFTEIEVLHELARRRYGARLANAVYTRHVDE